MFGTLFLKECKQILKSMVYYIYVVVFILFLTSQLSGELTDRMVRPQPEQDSYGTVNSHGAQAVMEKTLAGLVMETYHNSYATYPLGFYKGVTLNETELSKVKAVVETCTGKSWEQLEQEMQDHFSAYKQDTIAGAMQAQMDYSVVPKEGFDFESFSRQMEDVCRIIGKGSAYGKEQLDAGVGVPMTYEQAVEEYEALCSKDRITGATARLFCDYAGIVLSVLPIFLGVTRCLRDKRAQVSQVVFARNASAFQIIGSRYLANVCMAFLPVMITAFIMQMPYQYHAKTIGVAPDVFAFLKYGCVWLLPEIMAVLAVSFLITEFTDSVAAIFIQVFWAVASLFSSVTLQGDFGWNLVIRWNALGGTAEFFQQRQEFFLNRGGYAGGALAVLALTAAVYERKRRGGRSVHGTVSQNRR